MSVSGKPLFDDGGTFRGYRGTATDITAQVLAEANYRTIFDNAQAGIGQTRLSDGKVLRANKRLAQMFGYDTPEQFIDQYNFAEHYVDPSERARPPLRAGPRTDA